MLRWVALGGVVLLVIWKHRIWTISLNAWYTYLLLFFAVEFANCRHHRLSHEVRWFWATHSAHHSPQKMYLSGAIRLGLRAFYRRVGRGAAHDPVSQRAVGATNAAQGD